MLRTKPILLVSLISAISLTACQKHGADAPKVDLVKPQDGTATVDDGVAVVPTKQALFGDLHVHTSQSFDAFVFGVRRSPEDAYRFAMGEAIPQDAGGMIQLEGPPLDFYAVTDKIERASCRERVLRLV